MKSRLRYDCKSWEICCSILHVRTEGGWKTIYPGETLAKANLQNSPAKLSKKNGGVSGSFKRKSSSNGNRQLAKQNSKNGSFQRRNSNKAVVTPQLAKIPSNNAGKPNNNTPNGKQRKRWWWQS